MTRLIVLILYIFLPAWALAQDSAKVAQDSLRRTDSAKQFRDSLRHTDSAKLVKKAGDSVHYSDTTKYHWSWAATGNINNTNTVSSYLISNAASVSAARKKSTLNLSTSWVYGAQATNLTNNDFTSTLDFSMYKTLRHFYYWGLLTYNTSLSLRVNNLLQSGGGFGYNLVDKKMAAVIVMNPTPQK